MVDKIKVMIVDDNSDFVDLIKECLDKEDDIYICCSAGNGIDAVNLIPQVNPDVILLDVVMPKKDGMGVLEEISEMNLPKKPITIMITAIGQDHFIRKAISLGAEYYILKPLDLELLPTRIRQIYYDTVRFKKIQKIDRKMGKSTLSAEVRNESVDLAVLVTRLMCDIGVPPHLKGYQYIRQAVIETINSEKGFLQVTKELYPLLADSFNTTPGKVERAIRGAIQKTWSRINVETATKYFVYADTLEDVRPTNSEFIATLADKIRMSVK